ncbi:unnamed protein product [Somion occarium]|uniref:Uncharacterized protein n=1 Tax=Somion occarium TaxID=3059160 RepID=A0ABP1CY92_9APHY
MFPKIFFALALVPGLTFQVSGQALVAPPIGVAGTTAQGDVQEPSDNAPCGAGVDIAQTLAASTPIVAAADGSFTATVTNFNSGADGSRQVTAAVDPTATGQTFQAATVTTNGDAAPNNVGSQQITVQLPTGTTCTGGANGNQCLVSFKTSAGFGNCVLIQQDGAATGGGAPASTATGNVPAGGASTDGLGPRAPPPNDAPLAPPINSPVPVPPPNAVPVPPRDNAAGASADSLGPRAPPPNGEPPAPPRNSPVPPPPNGGPAALSRNNAAGASANGLGPRAPPPNGASPAPPNNSPVPPPPPNGAAPAPPLNNAAGGRAGINRNNKRAMDVRALRSRAPQQAPPSRNGAAPPPPPNGTPAPPPNNAGPAPAGNGAAPAPPRNNAPGAGAGAGAGGRAGGNRNNKRAIDIRAVGTRAAHALRRAELNELA